MVRFTLWKVFLIVGIVGIALIVPSIGNSGKIGPDERTANMSAAPWAVIPMRPSIQGQMTKPVWTIGRCNPARVSVRNAVSR